jgi:hypothetical protein
MTRKLKTLGLALIAVLAIVATAVAPAYAVEFTLTAGEYPATLDGTSLESTIFNLGGRETTCTKTTFGASLEEKESTTLLIGREYSGCSMKFLGTLPATIKTNGCAFETHLIGKLSANVFEANVDFVCEGSAGIEVYVYATGAKHTAGEPVCIYEMPPQNGRSTVEFRNFVGESHIAITPRVKGIQYKILKGEPFVCGLESESGIYTGSTTVTATNKGGKKISLTVVEK